SRIDHCLSVSNLHGNFVVPNIVGKGVRSEHQTKNGCDEYQFLHIVRYLLNVLFKDWSIVPDVLIPIENLNRSHYLHRIVYATTELIGDPFTVYIFIVYR